MNWKGFGTGNILVKKHCRKIMNNLSQLSQYSDQDMNQAPPTHESAALLLHHPAPVVLSEICVG
jgi:hypothetical protein